MFSNLSSLARSGVIGLAVLASVPASAAPLGPTVTPAVADSTAAPIILAQGEGRDHANPAYNWRRYNRNWGGGGNWGGGPHWNGGGPRWNGGGPRWNGGGPRWTGGGPRWNNGGWNGRHWGGRNWAGNNYWHRRGWHGGWGGWGGWGPGVALGIGIPLGYGLYGGDNYYYGEPIYRPRYYPRAYRSYGGSAHVEWCYARYRSYRASDNTFQPYYGPRRQCISPYG